MASYYFLNGSFHPETEYFLGPESRAFRFGEGLFETMRWTGSEVPLIDYHFNRLSSGLSTLGFTTATTLSLETIQKAVQELCVQNNNHGHARIRLVAYAGDGSISEPRPEEINILIQSWDLPNEPPRQSNGLELTILPDAGKATDKYSNLKSNNFLIYTLAARYAQEHAADEAIVLNTHGRVADASMANLFWIENTKVFTPPLNEGPVSGVMRRYLIEHLPLVGLEVSEKKLDIATLEKADEIFLSNAVYGTRWVRSFQKRQFPDLLCRQIFQQLILPLYFSSPTI